MFWERGRDTRVACAVQVFDPIEPSPGRLPSRSGRTLLLLAVFLFVTRQKCCNRPQRATLRGFLLPLSTTFTTAGAPRWRSRPGKLPAIALSRPVRPRRARRSRARVGTLGCTRVVVSRGARTDFARWGSEVLDESPVTARDLVETMDDDLGARFDALYDALQAAGACA